MQLVVTCRKILKSDAMLSHAHISPLFIVALEFILVVNLFLMAVGEQRELHRKLIYFRWNGDFSCHERAGFQNVLL